MQANFRILFTLCLMVGMGTSLSHAIVVQNITTGDVLFDSGGFEAGDVGSAPGSKDPVEGRWKSKTGVKTHDFASTEITPYDGEKFIELAHTGNVNAALDNVDFAAGSAGDVIEAKFALYVAKDATEGSDLASVRVRMQGGGSVDLLFFADGSIKGHYGDDERQGTGGMAGRFVLKQKLNTNDWNTIALRYAQNTDTAQISVNGSPFEETGVRRVGMIQRISFRVDSGGLSYIDSVPEVVSMVLVGLGGGLALLRRSRRQS